MTLHVRWPGKTGGAFGFALIFLLLFASRQKVDRSLQLNKVQTNCIEAKVYEGLATLRHHRNKFISYKDAKSGALLAAYLNYFT